MRFQTDKSIRFEGNRDAIDEYYIDQAGHGLPAFQGVRIQRGHGIGNMFSGLLKSAMPLIKKGSKALGKQVLSTGLDIANDLLSGENIRTSTERRLKEAGRNIMNQARGRISKPPGEPSRKGIKRRANSSVVIPKRAKVQRTSKPKRDIFT